MWNEMGVAYVEVGICLEVSMGTMEAVRITSVWNVRASECEAEMLTIWPKSFW
jgi:hypothetical protein